MTRALLALFALTTAGTASAQIVHPGQTYVGDPMADRHRHRIEAQRQQSVDQAAFARQNRFDARLTQLEIQAQRLPEPHVPLVSTPPRSPGSPEAQRAERERASAARRAAAAGVTQIDDWLARGPR